MSPKRRDGAALRGWMLLLLGFALLLMGCTRNGTGNYSGNFVLRDHSLAPSQLRLADDGTTVSGTITIGHPVNLAGELRGQHLDGTLLNFEARFQDGSSLLFRGRLRKAGLAGIVTVGPVAENSKLGPEGREVPWVLRASSP